MKWRIKRGLGSYLTVNSCSDFEVVTVFLECRGKKYRWATRRGACGLKTTESEAIYYGTRFIEDMDAHLKVFCILRDILDSGFFNFTVTSCQVMELIDFTVKQNSTGLGYVSIFKNGKYNFTQNIPDDYVLCLSLKQPSFTRVEMASILLERCRSLE